MFSAYFWISDRAYNVVIEMRTTGGLTALMSSQSSLLCNTVELPRHLSNTGNHLSCHKCQNIFLWSGARVAYEMQPRQVNVSRRRPNPRLPSSFRRSPPIRSRRKHYFTTSPAVIASGKTCLTVETLNVVEYCKAAMPLAQYELPRKYNESIADAVDFMHVVN